MRWCLWKNTQLPILLVEKGLRQEGHPAVKFLLKPESFNVMSNIVVRNNGNGILSEGVVNGRANVNVGPVISISCEILQKRFKLRIASLNVGTVRGRASDIVETLARRRIDRRRCSTRMITGNHCRYKFLWSGDTSGFGGVGILVAEKWVEKIISVDRTSCRQMSLRILIGKKILYIISSYAPQSGLSESEKDTFFFDLLSCISIVPAEEMLLVCGDLNGHVGKTSSGFEGLHGGHGYGDRNPEDTRILELCVSADLVITNTFFTKCDSQLLTFRSGNACSQIDYILVRKSDFKSVRDVKVISGEVAHSIICSLETLSQIHHSANHVVHHQSEDYGNCLNQKYV